MWCLLCAVRVSDATAALLAHLPPHWQPQQRLTQWKRRGLSTGEWGGEAPSLSQSLGSDGRLPCVTQPHRPTWKIPHVSDAATASSAASPRLSSPASGPHAARGPGSSTADGDVGMALDQVSRLHGFLSHRDIPQLIRQTNYTRQELFAMFLRFKSLCCLSPESGPEGIDAATFQRGVVRLSVEDSSFVSRVFALVDTDNSNSIEWDEFLCAVTALEKGSAEIKAKFACQVYDLDGDGFIGKADLTAMFTASSMLKAGEAVAGASAAAATAAGESDDSLSDAVIAMFVAKVFESLGCAESGLIAFEDVLRHIKSSAQQHDVWDLLGRSMLTDNTTAPHSNRHTSQHAQRRGSSNSSISGKQRRRSSIVQPSSHVSTDSHHAAVP